MNSKIKLYQTAS